MTQLTTLLDSSAPPRWATKRTPELPSYGSQVALLAQHMGWELLPWQQLVADVASEILPDGSWRYPTVIVTTPRQAGKSSLLGALLTHRAITQPHSFHWYTAQTGAAARDTWRKWVPKMQELLPNRWAMRMAAGAETATFTASSGFVRAFPPTPKALHGQQGDTVVLDEMWSFAPDSGDALLQAVIPTQATRPRRQLWLISTAGDEESVWWRSWIDRGREATQNPESQVAFFEWSAPEDRPHDDPDTWREFHPAYGKLISHDAMQAALDQFGADQFARGYLNRWPTAEASWRAAWPTLADAASPIPADAPVHLAIDASPNHRNSAITAAAALPDGRIAVEVIEHRPGTEWLVPRVKQLAVAHRSAVTLQRTGPLGHLLDELQAAGVRIQPASATEYADAVARFRTLVAQGKLAHADDPRLNAAVDSVETAQRGERPIWRRAPGAAAHADISPLVAATFSAWKASQPLMAPKLYTL